MNLTVVYCTRVRNTHLRIMLLFNVVVTEPTGTLIKESTPFLPKHTRKDSCVVTAHNSRYFLSEVCTSIGSD